MKGRKGLYCCGAEAGRRGGGGGNRRQQAKQSEACTIDGGWAVTCLWRQGKPQGLHTSCTLFASGNWVDGGNPMHA